MSVVGAFSSFLTPSVGLLLILSGDDDDGVMLLLLMLLLLLFVVSLMGTKALRISSGADSLPLSEGLRGGVRDGLLAKVRRVVEGVGGVAECTEDVLCESDEEVKSVWLVGVAVGVVEGVVVVGAGGVYAGLLR